MLRGLSKNQGTAMEMGKEGVMVTLAGKVLPKLAAGATKKSAFVTKLRLALETLHYLTRPSK